MWIITHTLSPLVAIAAAEAVKLERSGETTFDKRHYCFFAMSGALPDVLTPHLTLAARYASWSHTVWFAAVFAVITFFAAYRFTGSRPFLTAVLMIFAYVWHLFCDGIAGGIAWMYPFSKNIIGKYYVPAEWWWLLDVACVVLTLSLLVWIRWRAESKQRAGWTVVGES